MWSARQQLNPLSQKKFLQRQKAFFDAGTRADIIEFTHKNWHRLTLEPDTFA
jgi:hypothetical protein